MKIDKKNIFNIFQSGLLLVPGFLYAIFSLALSSNRLLPDKANTTLLLLNIAQLLSFGITIGKYAADLMILAKLNQNENTALKKFFFKRVLPFSLLFCLFLFYSNGPATAFALFICIPIEVFVIITIVELNISRRYYTALLLNLIGYPLVFTAYIIFSNFINLLEYQILLIFAITSICKLIVAINLRKIRKIRYDVLSMSTQVPLQQAGNYLLFKVDQVVIASNLVHASFFKFLLPTDYLFYSKFTEVFSGIATSLGPILAKFKNKNSDVISIIPLLKKRKFIAILFLAIGIQVFVSFILLVTIDKLHILMLLPFSIVTLLIIPVNMINYELYRTNDLKMGNLTNVVCFIVSAIFITINSFIKSPLLFAWIVPVQLLVFILIFYYRKSRKYV